MLTFKFYSSVPTAFLHTFSVNVCKSVGLSVLSFYIYYLQLEDVISEAIPREHLQRWASLQTRNVPLNSSNI